VAGARPRQQLSGIRRLPVRPQRHATPANVSAILLRGQHAETEREPQGECFGPTSFSRDCSNRLLGGLDSHSKCNTGPIRAGGPG